MSFVKTVGHSLLSAMFISGGWNAFVNPDGRAQKAEKAGIPMARQATILNGAAMTLAGSALALDIAPKLSALVLIGTLIPTTYVGHAFWQEDVPANRAGQQIHFLKNLAMIGGLIAVLQEK
ncbi:MAG: DoxX family protein [Ktedonobacteraceae bacterium]|nr:DoxX family protein [Ktedonobacteraceae bacterium]